MKTKYSSYGSVIGNLWGGGKGIYVAKRLKNYDSKEELIKDLNKMLDDCSLDDGMGFESLTGAVLTITTKTSTIIDNKVFTNYQDEFITIGKFTPEEAAEIEKYEMTNF